MNFPLRFLAVVFVLAGASSASAAKFATNQAADVVLGQVNFTSSNGTSGLANRFQNPEGVATDPTTGKVFVADSGNNRVLRFASAAAAQNGANPEAVIGQPNNTASSFNQGGNATAKTLSFPFGIAVDSIGRLWVADHNNHRVLGYFFASTLTTNAAADIVLGQPDFTTTLAGTTASKMFTPGGVSVGPDDTLWVADAGNSRVLRFANVTSKADGDAADGVLGQTDFLSSTGSTAINGLKNPYAVFADASGRLWVGDTFNNRVLRFDSAVTKATTTGGNANAVLGQTDFVTSTFSPPATANRFGKCYGVYLDPSGTLWVSDIDYHRVLGFTGAASLANGGAATIALGQLNLTNSLLNAASDRTFLMPTQVAAGPSGTLLISDYNAHRVLRFSAFSLPALTITTKAATVAKATLLISGKTTGTVTSVSYRVGTTGTFKKAVGTANWKFTANLKKGKNTISVFATGPGGVSTTRKLIITRK
jgi:sugar lactone lactonase YvrE